MGRDRRDEYARVLGETDSDRGDGAGLDHEKQSPAVEESAQWAEGLAKVDVLSAGMGHGGRKLGALTTATATSFFPAKPLGCYGDGGAVFTDDDALAARVRSLRVHGEGADKYEAVRIGLTGRLDTIQAAVLLEKLKIFPDEIAARDRVAARYAAGLGDVAIVPRTGNQSTSVWAQYTIRLEPGRHDGLAAALKAQGIPTAIYYTKPLHLQPA